MARKIMKTVFSSKTVWFNIIMTVIGTGAFIQGMGIENTALLHWAILVQGVGNVVLRVWFTKEPIG